MVARSRNSVDRLLAQLDVNEHNEESTEGGQDAPELLSGCFQYTFAAVMIVVWLFVIAYSS